MVDKKRIAKNSLWLYLRMLVVTVVSLYTSRIVLKSLGVSDFGIYNATGSLVSFSPSSPIPCRMARSVF